MSSPLAAASLVLFALAILHSIIGEVLLLRTLEQVRGLPVIRGDDAFARRSLRATWHTATILGVALAVLLGRLALEPAARQEGGLVIGIVGASLFASGLLWLVATRGKHPGWAGFVAAAVLCWIGGR